MYEKDDLEAKALAAIKKHKLTNITHLVAFLPISRAWFYQIELDKLDSIKDALELQKVSKKVKMQNRWEKSESPVLQIALYKLLADDDERAKLSAQHIDHTTLGQPLPPSPPVIVFYKPQEDGSTSPSSGDQDKL